MPRFPPTRKSLGTHRVPAWYEDAKLGIFVHWTPASVPGFAPTEWEINELARERYDDMLPLSPYTEWYENAIKFPWSPSARHHREHHGDRPYAEFAADFERGLESWDPAEWAALFRRAGARYVVLVTKHHDGYCLWPSRVGHPTREAWHTRRDCISELATAVRAEGMRFGVYYSGGIDWSFNSAPVRSFGDFIASVPRGSYPAYAEAQVHELIETLEPDILWNDISWPTSEKELLRLFADYYAAVPDGLVNDRWATLRPVLAAMRWQPLRRGFDALAKRSARRSSIGTPPALCHHDTRTPEYAIYPDVRRHKWECVRGMDKSFGFNRASREADFISRGDLVHSLVDIVSKNGNLLLNVGPRGEDASIPSVQRQRLEWLGDFLERSGEALYDTRPWHRAEGESDTGRGLRFTFRGETLYVVLLGTPPPGRLSLRGVRARPGAAVELLGHGPVTWKGEGEDLQIDLPQLPESPAHAFAIRGI